MRLLFYVVSLLLTVPAFGQPELVLPAAGVSNDDGGFADVGPYQPIPISSLKEVPTGIRGMVLRHLANRLGTELLGRLTFQEGEVIDHHRLYRDNPDARDYKWTIPTYILNFAFTDRAKGIVRYDAQIGLSSTGKVVQEINLPDMRQYRTPYSLISVGEAAKVASTMGLPPGRIYPEILYREDKNAIVWRFSETVFDDGSVEKKILVDIDAHSGKLAGSFFASAIR